MKIYLAAKCENENAKVEKINVFFKGGEETSLVWDFDNVLPQNGGIYGLFMNVSFEDEFTKHHFFGDIIGAEIRVTDGESKIERNFTVERFDITEYQNTKHMDPKSVCTESVDSDIVYWAQHCIEDLKDMNADSAVIENVKQIRDLGSGYRHGNDQEQKAQELIDKIDPCITKLEEDFGKLTSTKAMKAFYAEAEAVENSAMYTLNYMQDKENREQEER